MRALWLLVLAGCSSKEPAPPSPTPPPTSPAAPSEVTLDSGAFVVDAQGKAFRESFTLVQKGERKLLTVSAPHDKGELETDLADRPVRARYERSGTTYTLEGTPLAFATPARRRVAPGPVEVHVHGPGTAAQLAPLCKVTGEVVMESLDFDRRYVQAYRGAPVEELPRVVVEYDELDLELVCEGAKLVALALPERRVWAAREGREAALAALKSAPRPAKRAWKHLVDDSEPWSARATAVVGGLVIARDARRYVQRFTALDPATQTEVAQREVDVIADDRLDCDVTGGKLLCSDRRSGYLRTLDPRTLADEHDFAPALASKLDAVETVAGTLVDVKLANATYARLDLRTRTVRPIAKPAASGTEPPGCTYDDKAEVTVGTETFDRLACDGKPTPFAILVPYVDEAKTRVVSIARAGAPAWSLDLGAKPRDILSTPTHLVFGLDDPQRRVLVVDKRTGAIVWTFKQGARPATP